VRGTGSPRDRIRRFVAAISVFLLRLAIRTSTWVPSFGMTFVKGCPHPHSIFYPVILASSPVGSSFFQSVPPPLFFPSSVVCEIVRLTRSISPIPIREPGTPDTGSKVGAVSLGSFSSCHVSRFLPTTFPNVRFFFKHIVPYAFFSFYPCASFTVKSMPGTR